jgi:hypothetical protein
MKIKDLQVGQFYDSIILKLIETTQKKEGTTRTGGTWYLTIFKLSDGVEALDASLLTFDGYKTDLEPEHEYEITKFSCEEYSGYKQLKLTKDSVFKPAAETHERLREEFKEAIRPDPKIDDFTKEESKRDRLKKLAEQLMKIAKEMREALK